MPKPPGSRLQTRPRAPPSLPCRDVPPRHVLQRSEDGGVTDAETYVNRKATRFPASPAERIARGIARLPGLMTKGQPPKRAR
jgi:hypothetical protein